MDIILIEMLVFISTGSVSTGLMHKCQEALPQWKLTLPSWETQGFSECRRQALTLFAAKVPRPRWRVQCPLEQEPAVEIVGILRMLSKVQLGERALRSLPTTATSRDPPALGFSVAYPGTKPMGLGP